MPQSTLTQALTENSQLELILKGIPTWLYLLPALIQGVIMAIDEFYFHYKRGLPKWEAIGHPVDTLFLFLPLAFIWTTPMSTSSLLVYMGLSLLSCVMITKDEWVHSSLCAPMEQWLHSLLFVLHPTVLFAYAVMWGIPQLPGPGFQTLLLGQLIAMGLFMIYQIFWWNLRPYLSQR